MDETEQTAVFRKFTSFILRFCIRINKLEVLRNFVNAPKHSRAPAVLSCELFALQPRKCYEITHSQCNRLSIEDRPAISETKETDFTPLRRRELPICYAKCGSFSDCWRAMYL